MNPNGAGYDVYDLWDLGEFDQKGARRTHWGSRDELDELRQKSKELEVDLIWDAVLSHKAGADSTEEVWAVEVDRGGERCGTNTFEAERMNRLLRNSLKLLTISYEARQTARDSIAKADRGVATFRLSRPSARWHAVQSDEVAFSALQRHRLGPSGKRKGRLQAY